MFFSEFCRLSCCDFPCSESVVCNFSITSSRILARDSCWDSCNFCNDSLVAVNSSLTVLLNRSDNLFNASLISTSIWRCFSSRRFMVLPSLPPLNSLHRISTEITTIKPNKSSTNIAYFAASSACDISAIMSSICSIPTDILTISSLTPAALSSSVLSCL